MEKLNNSIDELVEIIVTSSEYKTCIKLKEQMKSNEELLKLIDDVKNLQKKYIKSNYSEEIKQQLQVKEEELNQIQVYTMYNENLQVVNNMINIINDELNNYFYNKLNKEIGF